MTTKQVSRSERRRRSRERRLKRLKALESHPEQHSVGKAGVTYEDLDKDQLMAYKAIHEWWLTQKTIGGVARPLTLAGYSGTGKSTLLSIALPDLRNPDGSCVKTAYAAYTGKAASVLVAKGLPATTIHSLIYNAVPDPESDSGIYFELKTREDIEADLIVIDEASMVPDDMRGDLESLGIPILYTGDHGQIPPVTGFGNIMENPELRLETPHRQALESGIIELGTMIRNKKNPKRGVYGVHEDAEVLPRSAINDIDLLGSADMVICYTNRKREELNRQLRKYKGFSGKYPEKGEKIICIKNNKNTGMINGLILEVVSLVEEGGYLVMDLVDETGKKYNKIKAFTNYFDGLDHPQIRGQTGYDVFEFAYAITGHKSQGSQWDHVVVVEEPMYKQTMDFKRRWKYTVVTRAAKRLSLILK